MMRMFSNRAEAGEKLAAKLSDWAGRDDVVVLALPRGGVPVAAQIARRLRAPLNIIVVRKLGVPGHEEFAMGALASGGTVLLNQEVTQQLGISSAVIKNVIARETEELARREMTFNQGKSIPLAGRAVILVDDGIATGSTMKAAVSAVREQGAARVIVAVSVAPAEARMEFKEIADEFICVVEPKIFYAVGECYRDFAQTTDEEVRELLATFGKQPVSEFR